MNFEFVFCFRKSSLNAVWKLRQLILSFSRDSRKVTLAKKAVTIDVYFSSMEAAQV